jgi:hypothetical protein
LDALPTAFAAGLGADFAAATGFLAGAAGFDFFLGVAIVRDFGNVERELPRAHYQMNALAV